MHERKPLVTIAIVNYNYEEFVADAIDSALEQSYAPLEVVVVDDGSTDCSRDIISAYGKRIRTVFQSNAGQGSAYNAGWRAARGDFVHFLDSDDVLTPDAVAKIVEAFNRSAAVKVQFYLEKVDRNLKPLGLLLPSYPFSRIEPRRQIANYGYYVSPPASGNAYRKTFLDAIMPIADQERYRHAPDGYTTGLAGIAGHIESIPETLGYYRIHGDNYGGEAGIKSVRSLHHMFMRETNREASAHEFADRFDFHFLADRSRFCPGHTKFRLLSRRLLPDVHPIKSDTVGGLAVSGFVSAWTYPHLKPTKRFGVALGFIMLGLAPRPLLRRYFSAIASPHRRNRTDSGASSFDGDIPSGAPRWNSHL